MLLVATDLSKSHGLRELFHGVCLSVADGDRVGFIGPNGAGKSTLLRMLAGAEEPDEGSVRTQRSAVIVYVPQRDDFPAGLTPRTAATAAAMKAASVHGDHHEAEVLGGMILGKLGFPEARMDEPVERLSGGWKKRLSIACGLCEAGGAPDLLLLTSPPTTSTWKASAGWSSSSPAAPTTSAPVPASSSRTTAPSSIAWPRAWWS